MIKDLEIRKSKWLRDLIRFLPLKSQFVLSGNVRDLQIEDKIERRSCSFSHFLLKWRTSNIWLFSCTDVMTSSMDLKSLIQ